MYTIHGVNVFALARYVHWKSTIKTWGERNMPNAAKLERVSGQVQVAETLAPIATPFAKWVSGKKSNFTLFQLIY